MDCRGHDVQEAPVRGIGSEIDNDLRPRGYGCSYLKVKHYLKIGVRRIEGIGSGIVRSTSRKCGDANLRGVNPQLTEISVQLALTKTAAQFNDPNRLAAAIQVSGKIVPTRHLNRSETARHGHGRMRRLRARAEMRSGKGFVAQAEYAGNDGLETLG